MSLRFAHELGFAIAMSLGLMSVLAGNELPLALWLAMAVPWLAMAMRFRDKYGSTLFGTLLAFAGFGWAGTVLLQQGLDGSLIAAAVALVSIVVARLSTRRTPNHDLQALVLSLLLVFAGTVLHQEFTFGIVFLLYAVAVTWALLTRQLIAGAEIESYRTGGVNALRATLSRRDVVTPTFFAVTAMVALIILLGTTVLFVLFPRVGLGGLGIRSRGNGRLPSNVSLLGTPRALLGGGQVVARLSGVSYSDFARGLYMRGSVYDQIDQAGFSRSGNLLDVRPTHLNVDKNHRPVRYEVFLEPVTENQLLTLGPVKRAQDAQVITGGFANPSGVVRIIGLSSVGELLTSEPLGGPVRYRVNGNIMDPSEAPTPQTPGDKLDLKDTGFSDIFLQLPDVLDPRVARLAARITQGLPTFAAKAAAIRHHLLTTFTYTLDQPNTGKQDPLASFLFDDRRGHCEYFATAFALLLRLNGIPSRVVGGYMGGSWDSSADLVVFTGSNAHAWVEWYEPGRGWVVDDATPPVDARLLSGIATMLERARRFWDDEVVDFGLEQQAQIFSSVVSTFRTPVVTTKHLPVRQVVVGLLGVMLGTLLILLRRGWRRRQRTSVSPLVRALESALQRVTGEPVPPSYTLREAVQKLLNRLPQTSRDTLQDALQVYEVSRFRAESRNVRDERRVIRDLRRVFRNHKSARLPL
jgi:protein-glutamine gamma-glutamyltransferase